mgnify:CR=1 FL=1
MIPDSLVIFNFNLIKIIIIKILFYFIFFGEKIIFIFFLLKIVSNLIFIKEIAEIYFIKFKELFFKYLNYWVRSNDFFSILSYFQF